MIPSRPIPRIPSYTPELRTYLNNVAAISGSVSMDTVQALDRFVRDCYNAGIWTKLVEVYPFVGTNLATAMVKLKAFSAIFPVLTAVNVVEGDYVERGATGGIAGNGTTKYINTNFVQSSMGATGHMTAYVREAEATGAVFWVAANTATEWTSLGNFAGAQTPYSLYGGNAQAAVEASNAIPALYAANRSSGTQLDVLRNGVVRVSNTNLVATAFGPINFYVAARNNNGVAASFSAKKISFVSLGETMTTAEHLALYNAVQNLQTNLSRNV
jgi:hypothetical protein